MIEKLNGPPDSGEYEEILFDIPGPWREQVWHYVKFTTKDGIEWVGGFREKDHHNFIVAELEERGIACVVSGGHGYLVDIERKQKIKDLETDTIIDLITDPKSESFYISRWWDLKIVDKEFNEIGIKVPIDCDGIYFKEKKGRELNLEIEEIGADIIKNLDYYVDLDERKIKKRGTSTANSKRVGSANRNDNTISKLWSRLTSK